MTLDQMDLRPSVQHSVHDMIAEDKRAAKRYEAQAERLEKEGRLDLAARFRKIAADRLAYHDALLARYGGGA